MPILPFPEYAPDLPDYEGQTTKTLLNVLPLPIGYGPFKAFNALSSALMATCRGFFYARNTDGSVTIFAATSTRLFTMSNTDFSWKPVSRVVALTSISNASPGVFTYTAHGLAANDPLVLSTSGALPTGLTVGTVYYVKTVLTADTFTVAASVGGAAINTSSAGSGTHSMTFYYTAIPTGDQWQFAQFNNFVFAVQINIAPQVFNLASSTAFADLAGSPPQARYIAVVGRFVMLTGITSTAYRVHWSGYNATTTWTSGTNQSDFQDLPTGGIVRSIIGGEQSGILTQDNAIRRLTYNPGSPTVFNFETISDDRGIFSPLSGVRGGDRAFYIGTDGFKMVLPGGSPQPIGRNKVDETFFADVDDSNLQLCIGASDPKAGKAYWAYKSRSGASGFFDKIICYDWNVNKFTPITISGEYIAALAQPGLTLENLDSINSSIDALTFSLDDVTTAAFPKIAAFNSDHKAGFFSGSNLEATMVTAEKGGDGRRIRVKGFRPITDASTAYGSVFKKETSQATGAYSSEVVMNSIGMVPHNVSTRYARGKVRIPASTTWTHAIGIEPVVGLEGKR